MITITREILMELFEYDKKTGDMIWINPPKGFQKLVGVKAGYINTYNPRKKYRVIGIFNNRYLAHRLVWMWHYGNFSSEIDHINGNGLDNRIENLRQVNRKENCRNRGLRSDNKSGVTGVIYDGLRKVWRARIKVEGKDIHLGGYKTKEEAIEARSRANKKYSFHENHGSDRSAFYRDN